MSTNKDTTILERQFVSKGTLVMSEGEVGGCAYLIQSGAVQVYASHDGKVVELARLEAGQIFGETALIFDGPRTASVRALENCNLIVITPEVLKQKLRRSDVMVRAIVEMLIKRMVAANNVIIDQGVDVSDLADTTRIIYQNVLGALPEGQQVQFQNEVLPKLDAFMNALQDFQKH